MGMFSSLFGKSGSDKADKMRQAAIDAFNSIQTPELKNLQVQLDKYVQAGQLSPDQAEAQLLGSNAFKDITTDPSLSGAQKQALSSMQNVGNSGGLTAIDKARLEDITRQQNQEAQSRNASIMQNAQQRGVGSSDLNVVNELQNEQAAADRASRQGTDVAAQAQARALQAMQAAGKQATDIRGQDYSEQANKAQAQNAIDLFNKQTLNQTNLYNVDAANKAQAANLANAQEVSNANTGTSNANKTYNAQQEQQLFNDKMAKAHGVAGTYNAWAGDAEKNAATDKAADVGFTTGALKAGATALGTAFGGPIGGAAVASSMDANGGMPNKKITEDQLPGGYSHGGPVSFSPIKPAIIPQPRYSSKAPPIPHPMHLPHQYEEGGRVMECNCGGAIHMSDGGEATPPLRIESAENEHPLTQPHSGAPDFRLSDPHGEPIGDFKSYEDAAKFEQKVREKQPHTKDFRDGGSVPGHAAVHGDSPKNDTVAAKLSPGEVVVPRSAMSDEQEFDKFMEQFRPTKNSKPVDESVPPEHRALANLHQRVRALEGQ